MKLQYDEPLSSFAFKVNSRRYNKGRTFVAPFATTGRWQLVRVPFNRFQSENYSKRNNNAGRDTECSQSDAS